MNLRFRIPAVAVALYLAGILAACGEEVRKPVDTTTPVPDFSLTDVNPNSATHDQAVSPRDHLARVSAWYFGHAT